MTSLICLSVSERRDSKPAYKAEGPPSCEMFSALLKKHISCYDGSKLSAGKKTHSLICNQPTVCQRHKACSLTPHLFY